MSAYDLVAQDYDQSLQMPLRRYVEAFSVLRRVGDVNGLDVLDLACGTGLYARTLRRAGARVVGVDVSEAMIGVARSLGDGDYRVADATDLDAIGAFDLVLGVYLMHYAPTEDALRGMCRSIARNLKPGGRFVSFAANPDLGEPEIYRPYGLRMRIPDPEPDGCAVHFAIETPAGPTPELTLHRWRRATYEAALRAAGLDDLRWEDPEVAPEGVTAHGEAMWAAYLARPHCVLVSGRR